jgi:murein DD-endopeptidase MepM/ murein hydrolase activator NlpD
VTDIPPNAAPPSEQPNRRVAPSDAAALRAKRRVRGATYVGVAAVAAAAVYFTPQGPTARPLSDLSSAATVPPNEVAVPALPVWRDRTDTLASGESLVALLERAGVSRLHAADALRAAGSAEAKRLRPGVAVRTTGRTGDSLPPEITFQPEVDRVVHLRYLAGAWQRIEEKLAWTTDTVAARGVITSSLYDALHLALGDRLPRGKRSELVWKLADIFEYRVDLSHDLQPGDSVRLLVERSVAPDGSPRDAKILAASLSVSGKEVDAIRYTKPNGGGAFFDQYGKSLRAAFLRAPLEFRRVSSVFGMRNHPILGEWRMHKGTDYSAASGTPVRAIGDGRVIFAGVKSGFGNVLEVRHNNGYVSRYGHLRGFAKGVRRGSQVSIGKTIGFVGMTGLATAPHLHFEMLVDGVQRDPRKALRDKAGEPLSARDKTSFQMLRSRLLSALDVRPATGE